LASDENVHDLPLATAELGQWLCHCQVSGC